MNRRLMLPFAAAALLLAACQVTDAPPTAETPAVFAPPADGVLTAAQVERYLAVRRRTASVEGPEDAAVSRSLQASAERFGVGTAHALVAAGGDPEEFAWVEVRVQRARALWKVLSHLPPEARSVLDQDGGPDAENYRMLEPHQAELARLARES